MAERHRWLHGEMESWVAEGLITSEQEERLRERYPLGETAEGGGRSLVANLLAAFAMTLVGLGLLLFVASNWADMTNVLKVAVIFVVMTGAYLGGWMMYQRGRDGFGAAFTLLATIAFGAGIFLIGQMYHLVAYNASALLIWAGGTLLIAYIVRSQAVYFAALAELLAYDLMQSFEYHLTDWFFLPMMVLAVPFLLRQAKTRFATLVYMIVLSVGVLRMLGEHDLILIGAPTYALLVYLFGLWLRQGDEGKGIWVQLTGLRLSVLFVFILLATRGEWVREFLRNEEYVGGNLVMTGIFAFLALMTLLLQSRMGVLKREAVDLIYFLPILQATWVEPFRIPLLAGLLLVIPAVIWIIQGGAGDKVRVNNGSLFFGVAVFGMYLMVAKDLLSGSAGFLVGGIVLFAIAALVEKNRRSAIEQSRKK